MSQNKQKPALLLQYIRDGLVEQEHYGFIKLINANSVLKSIGDDKGAFFYQRSCAKPLQASLIIDLGLDIFFDLNESEIAVSCASHVGENRHTEIIENYLKKIGGSRKDLLCGLQPPISRFEQEKLIKSGNVPDILQNNCSGKHTFMLAVCKKLGLDIKSYSEINHPLQQMIYSQIKKLCNVSGELQSTKDGCGVPIWAATLTDLGKGYLNLFTSPKYKKITNAFLNNPYLIGGQNRLDSEIINAGKNLAAKVGAGGLCVVVNTETKEALVVKTADAELKSRTLITVYALLQLGWLSKKTVINSDLNNIFQTEIKTLHGEVIGKAVSSFNLL